VKEDVLEQIVDDYPQFRGNFTTHNVRFRLRADHDHYVGHRERVSSDVDVGRLRSRKICPSFLARYSQPIMHE
jgi:hypothetical protein